MENNPYGLIALWSQGDWIIKCIALLLLLMSVMTWYFIISRTWRAIQFSRLTRHAADFWLARDFSEGIQSLGACNQQNPFKYLALSAKNAVDHHSNQETLRGQLSLSEWLTESLRGAIDDSAERMQGGLSILASIGSTAPFVGLFGTVWGIYHALVGISISGQASIDKVAGPVGEALIMTAFGLAVAIPAVVGYNALIRANKRTIGKLNRFARQLHAYFLTGSPAYSEVRHDNSMEGR